MNWHPSAFIASFPRSSPARTRPLGTGVWRGPRPGTRGLAVAPARVRESEIVPPGRRAGSIAPGALRRVRLGLRTGSPQGMPPVRDRVLPDSRDFWSLAADGRCRRFLQGVRNRAGAVLARTAGPPRARTRVHGVLDAEAAAGGCRHRSRPRGWPNRRASAIAPSATSSATTWRGGYRRSRQAFAARLREDTSMLWLVF